MALYFAYGSNLNQEQMKQRCPESHTIGPAVLKDYQLSFTTYSQKRNCGCADIIPIKGHEVWGMVYQLTDADLKSLDRFEGANYRRIEVELMNADGEPMKAFTYVVVTKRLDLKPSKDYLGIILKGASDFSFPEKYKNYLLQIATL